MGQLSKLPLDFNLLEAQSSHAECLLSEGMNLRVNPVNHKIVSSLRLPLSGQKGLVAKGTTTSCTHGSTMICIRGQLPIPKPSPQQMLQCPPAEHCLIVVPRTNRQSGQPELVFLAIDHTSLASLRIFGQFKAVRRKKSSCPARPNPRPPAKWTAANGLVRVSKEGIDVLIMSGLLSITC